jgi:hypothetical protein
MGRKKKQPVEIHEQASTEMPPLDGLPPFQRFLDVIYAGKSGPELTRVFFTSSRPEEVDDYMKIRASGQYSKTFAMGTNTPLYQGFSKAPLFDYCLSLGFDEAFSTDLVRLVSHYLRGRQAPRGYIYTTIEATKDFVVSLDAVEISALTDIRREHWEAWLDKKEQQYPKRSSARTQADKAKSVFKSYAPTAMGGWLAQLRFGVGNYRMLDEHSSELAEADAGYSDEVMFQILAFCLEGFQRRIGYLRHYENVSPKDMPEDWLWPGRKAVEVRKGLPRKGRRPSDITQLLVHWLSSEDNYPIIINQILLDHKAGLIHKRNDGDGTYIGGTLARIDNLYKYPDFNPLVREFREAMARTHGYPLGSTTAMLSHYIKTTQPNQRNLAMDTIGWCLGNLIMMQFGINKEVVLRIPSRTKDGKSFLDRDDTLFPSSAGATESELYGIKAKTGSSPRKKIFIVVARNSPLFQMLRDYEKYVKADFDGPFFEFSNTFLWPTAGIKPMVAEESNFPARYPIYGNDGVLLPSIDTRRFRKVFASAKLLERMKGIKDMNELAERLRDDLNHGLLDTTLAHYLLKSATARSVIDIALATITSEKLREGLTFQGKIVVSGKAHAKKKVFLCECNDPANPSHDLPIADECKHYDLCLGCERSVVTRFHLPYICKRILQYEEARRRDATIWSATFENHWMIAHDALDRYAAADRNNGRRLVDDAWAAAHEGRVSLPPITNSPRI